MDTSRLHERLAQQIAIDIVSGRLPQDSIVPAAEALAAEHGVSRTVARETLQALDSAGLISVRHGKRTTVAPVQEWHFLDDLVQTAVSQGQVGSKLATDLLETRITLELAAVRWATERADDARLREILDLARHQVGLVAAEPLPLNDIVAADLKFHSLIAEGADNQVVTQLVTSLRRQLVPTWAMEQLSLEEHQRGANEHLAIAEALQTRDAERSVAEMRRHFRWAADAMLKRSLPDADHAQMDRQLYGR